MKYLLMLSLIVFASCTAVCPAAKSVSIGLSSALGAALSCKRVDLIQEDLSKALVSVGVCKEDMSLMRGPVADVVCPIAVPAALALVANQVPAKYECSPTAAVAGLTDILVNACKQIPL